MININNINPHGSREGTMRLIPNPKVIQEERGSPRSFSPILTVILPLFPLYSRFILPFIRNPP